MQRPDGEMAIPNARAFEVMAQFHAKGQLVLGLVTPATLELAKYFPRTCTENTRFLYSHALGTVAFIILAAPLLHRSVTARHFYRITPISLLALSICWYIQSTPISEPKDTYLWEVGGHIPSVTASALFLLALSGFCLITAKAEDALRTEVPPRGCTSQASARNYIPLLGYILPVACIFAAGTILYSVWLLGLVFSTLYLGLKFFQDLCCPPLPLSQSFKVYSMVFTASAALSIGTLIISVIPAPQNEFGFGGNLNLQYLSAESRLNLRNTIGQSRNLTHLTDEYVSLYLENGGFVSSDNNDKGYFVPVLHDRIGIMHPWRIALVRSQSSFDKEVEIKDDRNDTEKLTYYTAEFISVGHHDLVALQDSISASYVTVLEEEEEGVEQMNDNGSGLVYRRALELDNKPRFNSVFQIEFKDPMDIRQGIRFKASSGCYLASTFFHNSPPSSKGIGNSTTLSLQSGRIDVITAARKQNASSQFAEPTSIPGERDKDHIAETLRHTTLIGCTREPKSEISTFKVVDGR
ncbi:hypothetical protein TWF730_011066 [Orbilia blumenaviensis]|uniref:Uncharacterized protein n=1 Tax=Orbilia blumenaviensis TaxID=1796055 RepID=A0AAV9UMQ1_9PEZI